MYKAQINAVFL